MQYEELFLYTFREALPVHNNALHSPDACMLPQAWRQVVHRRRDGRARLQSLAASMVLAETGTQLPTNTPVATKAAAVQLAVIASWRLHVQVPLQAWLSEPLQRYSGNARTTNFNFLHLNDLCKMR